MPAASQIDLAGFWNLAHDFVYFASGKCSLTGQSPFAGWARFSTATQVGVAPASGVDLAGKRLPRGKMADDSPFA
jgi:hypothetical protein